VRAAHGGVLDAQRHVDVGRRPAKRHLVGGAGHDLHPAFGPSTQSVPAGVP